METHDRNDGTHGCAEAHEGWGESGGRLPHDQAWKALLWCASMMKSLILAFVNPDIVAELDLSRLERRSGEYVARGLRTLRGDIVWRAPWRDGSGHLYFPVELQSSPDPGMPKRMSEYSLQIFQAADPGELAPGEMPLVWPIVIYTGTVRWDAATSTDAAWRADRLPARRRALVESRQVRQSFDFLPVCFLPEDVLKRSDEIAAWIFRLAGTRTLEDLQAVSAEVFRRLMAPELAELREPVTNWLRHVHLPMLGIRDARLNNLPPEEFFAMAQAVFNEWKEEYREEGRIEGREEGRIEGIIEGRAEGIIEGRAEGRIEGRAEGIIEGEARKALEIARNLLRANAAPELVEAATGLPMEKVRELAAGLKKG